MPKNKFEGKIFALITILLTVPSFVLYCSSIAAGGLANVNLASAFALVPVELVLAFFSAVYIGNPLAKKIASKFVNPQEDNPAAVKAVMVCATVAVMCPWMSLLATLLHQVVTPVLMGQLGLDAAMAALPLKYLQAFLQNLPFALVTQMFVIQPLVRKIFAFIFQSRAPHGVTHS